MLFHNQCELKAVQVVRLVPKIFFLIYTRSLLLKTRRSCYPYCGELAKLLLTLLKKLSVS